MRLPACAAVAHKEFGLAEDLEQRLQHPARRQAGDRVLDRLSVPPRLHQPIPPQQREMLGHGGIAQIEERGKLADRTFALGQLAQDQQPMPIGERRSSSLAWSAAAAICSGSSFMAIHFILAYLR